MWKRSARLVAGVLASFGRHSKSWPVWLTAIAWLYVVTAVVLAFPAVLLWQSDLSRGTKLAVTAVLLIAVSFMVMPRNSRQIPATQDVRIPVPPPAENLGPAPTLDPAIALTTAGSSPSPRAALQLDDYFPSVSGYTKEMGSSASQSAGWFYFGPPRAGASRPPAYVTINLYSSEDEARARLPDHMHHVDETQIRAGQLTATGAWRPGHLSYMVGLVYGRAVVTIDAQRQLSDPPTTQRWAQIFAEAYGAELAALPKP